MKLQHILLLVLLILSAVWDLASFRIPNALLLTGWLIGFGFDPGLAYIARGTGAVLLLYPLAAFGFFGMGDIKMAGVLCSFLGVRMTCRCLLLSLLFAALCSIEKLLFQRELLERFVYAFEYVRTAVTEARMSYPSLRGRFGEKKYRGPNYEQARIPYGMMICLAYMGILGSEVIK